MTDERREIPTRSRSKAARCLVRIMLANLKRRGWGEAVHIISLKTGTEALLNSSCVIYSITALCVCHLSFRPYFILPFLQFPPIWIVAATYFPLMEMGGWISSGSSPECWCSHSLENSLCVPGAF